MSVSEPGEIPRAAGPETAPETSHLLKGIHWLGHASLLLEGSPVVYIDPFNIKGELPEADLILITHPHYDHCSPRDISRVLKKETAIIAPQDVLDKVPSWGGERIAMRPGTSLTWGELPIAAFPAYSMSAPQHPRSKEWLGYMLRWEGRWIYHAGDGNAAPAIPRGWLDAAFLQLDTSYLIHSDSAFATARKLGAGVTVPIHFGSVSGARSEAVRFVNDLNTVQKAFLPIPFSSSRSDNEDLPSPQLAPAREA